jgi:hypothetical protein
MRKCGIVRVALVLTGLMAAVGAEAQRLEIRSYAIGKRIFEMEEIGGNPATIGRLLKRPDTYQKYLSGITYNGFYGGLAVQRHHLYYLSAELGKSTSTSPFWRKHTVQVGVFMSNQLVKDEMALFNEQTTLTSNTTATITRDTYALVQKQRFLGATVGLNRRFRIVNRVQFVTGLHAQAGVAVVHKYEQRLDSAIILVGNGMSPIRQSKTSQGFDLKGRNYLQWQAMIPLGLEVDVYRNQLFVRLEADLGLTGNAFRPKDLVSREAHGIGVWVTYKLN